MPNLPSRAAASLSMLLAVAAATSATAQGYVSPYATPPVFNLPPAEDPATELSRYLHELADNPRDLAALIGAGHAALAAGDANAAIGFYGRADEASPNNARVKAGLGSAMVQLEQPREALRLFDQAVGAGLPPGEIAADRGLAYDLRGDSRRAQAEYQIALRADPRNDEATRRYALSLAIAGDRNGALALLDPLMRKQDKAAWRASAFVLALSGDPTGAVARTELLLPRQQAALIAPFFPRLAALSASQKASAVHFGRFPGDGRPLPDTQLADNRYASTPAPYPAPPQRFETHVPDALPDGSPLTTGVGAPLPDRPAPAARDTAPSWGRARVASPAPVVPASPPASRTTAWFGPSPAASRATASQPARAAPLAGALAAGAPGASVPLGTQARPVSPPVQTPPPLSTASAAAAPPAIGKPPSIPSASPTIARSLTPVAPVPTPVVPTASPPLRVAMVDLPPPPITIPPPPAPTLGVAEPSPVQGPPVAIAGPPPAGDQVAMNPGAPVASAPSSTPPAAESQVAPPAPIAAPVTSPPLPVPPIEPAPRPSPPRPAVIDLAATTAVDRVGPVRPRKAARQAGGTTDDLLAITLPTDAPPVTPKSAKVAGAASRTDGDKSSDKPANAAKSDKSDPLKAATAKDKAADTKAKADKVKADKAKADNDKPDKAKAEKAEAAAAKQAPERYWVQVATGANKGDLPKAWAGVKSKYGAQMAGRAPWTTPLRFTNRILVGPFKSAGEAQAFVNSASKAGLGATTFTSAKGQAIEKLGGE